MTQIKLSNSIALIACFFSIALVMTTGCDRTYIAQGDSTDAGQDSVETETRSEMTETTSVAPDKLTNLTSPADKMTVEAIDSTPEKVCRSFMDLLQSGDRIAAENLLTRTALSVTTRAGLQLEPMGGPKSEFKVNEVRFATLKNKLAQVECSIIDKSDGEVYEMDMAWLVRKHSTGWRISGVMLELEPGKSKDLLSFENEQDVMKIKTLAGADVVDEKSRQANAKDASIK